jgi:hypothetical protein
MAFAFLKQKNARVRVSKVKIKAERKSESVHHAYIKKQNHLYVKGNRS